ncbi:MAG: hypothetical protein HOQ09_06025 [Gemmatimonadaceae bacterium]|nr:hypothetical protein [Gemmatimonadaceae bacterium]
MALREFNDQEGRAWRAWDVTAEKLHPATRAEDYMRDYLDGWLAFESADGSSKCRLTPIPRNWATATDDRLREWLRAASPVRGDRISGPHGRTAAEIIAEAEAAAASVGGVASQGRDIEVPAQRAAPGDRGAARTFRCPGGRYWSVAEGGGPETPGGGARRVLRFTAGNRNLDLHDWPADWMNLPDAELAHLLGTRFPRRAGQPNPTPFRRRAGDM